MHQLDLNCDMGESNHLHPYNVSEDLQLLTMVSSINIACGFHAGDAHTMRILADAAIEKNIAIGAHPGYPDRNNFGRDNMQLSPAEIHDIILYQAGALQAILTARGTRLHHIKPHGALYNTAAKDIAVARAICKAIAGLDKEIILYGLSGSCMKQAAGEFGIAFVSEVFADRYYQDDGSLTPRSLPGALINDNAECAKQVLDMVLHGRVCTGSGNYISLKADSICLHADGAHALEFAEVVNKVLRENGVAIGRPF